MLALSETNKHRYSLSQAADSRGHPIDKSTAERLQRVCDSECVKFLYIGSNSWYIY